MRLLRIHDRILFVKFKNIEEMSKTVIRIGEYYEGRGSAFSKDHRPTFRQFLKWYKDNLDPKPYKNYFQGLSIPGYYITNFIKDYRPKEFSKKETKLVAALTSEIGKKDIKRNIKYTVIMCCQGIRSSVFMHEICHTMFYLDREFARKALNMLRKIKKEERKKMRNYLIKTGYGRDEISEEIFCRLIEKMSLASLFENQPKIRISGRSRDQFRALFSSYLINYKK